MIIWIAFAALTVATLSILLAPLFTARAGGASRADYDLTVYKDQLTEVEREVERGVLSPDQAEAARTEIQRRILAAGEAGRKAGPGVAPKRAMGLSMVLVVLAPVAAFGVYMLLGSPYLPDQPHAARAGQMQQMQAQTDMVRNMVAQLTAKLEKNPKDGKGWALLGRSLRVMGQTEQAKAAYAKALPLLPGDTQVRLDYAGMLLGEVPEGSILPPEFVGLMRDVLAAKSDSPEALYFVGLAEAQTGNKAKARDLWSRLLVLLPEGEDRTEITRQIESLK